MVPRLVAQVAAYRAVAGRVSLGTRDVQIDRVLREGVNLLPLLPPFPSALWNSEAPAGLVAGNSYPANRLRACVRPQGPSGTGGLCPAGGRAIPGPHPSLGVPE